MLHFKSSPPRIKGAIQPLIALACLAFATPNAFCDDIYSTGFEGPTYNVGTLGGQDSWGGPAAGSSAVVQTAIVESGLQAGQFDPNPAQSQNLIFHGLTYDSTVNSSPIVLLQMDAYITSAGTKPNWDIFSTFGNAGFIGQLLVLSDGDASLGLASSSVGSVPIAYDQWNTYDLLLNYDTSTQSAYVNGQLIGSGAFASSSTTLSQDELGQNSGGGTAQMYFDNLSVSTVTPEPGVNALLAGFAVSGVLFARRRRRVHP